MTPDQLHDLAADTYARWCKSHGMILHDVSRAHTRILPLGHNWQRIILCDTAGRAVGIWDRRNDGKLHHQEIPPHMPKVIHQKKPERKKNTPAPAVVPTLLRLWSPT